jgi:hypothetical protein
MNKHLYEWSNLSLEIKKVESMTKNPNTQNDFVKHVSEIDNNWKKKTLGKKFEKIFVQMI